VHANRGTGEAGIARVQAVLELVEARGSSSSLVRLCAGLTELLFFSGHYGEMWAASRRLVDLAESVEDDLLLARIRKISGLALLSAGPVGTVGRVAEALRLAEEAVRLAEARDDLDVLQTSVASVALIRAIVGEFAASRRDRRRALLLAEQWGDPTLICFSSAQHGWIAFLLGEWDEAKEDIERALGMGRQIRLGWAAPYALLNWGQLLLASGQWEEAARPLEEACTQAGRSGDLQALRRAAGLLAELEILVGRPDAARARLVPLLDRPGLEEYGVTALLPVLAWAHLALGEVAQAGDIVEQAIQRTRPEGLRLVLVDALRVQAMVAIRQERWQEAERALAEGLSLARAMPYPYAEARLLHLSGRLHAERRQPEAAREQLGAALAIFQRLGARKDVELVERDLAARTTVE
jgi:tetratricopeptide (TPR) repeat protein